MTNTTSRAAALLTLLLVACQHAPAPETVPAPVRPAARVAPAYANGEAVITAMRDRYAGIWYHTITFRQKSSTLSPKGTWTVQQWYEAMRLPGRLRIDFDPLKAGNGVLYARDTQYVMANGRISRADPGINDLQLLGFDVYANSTARTVALLRRQGFDVDRVHMDSFEGRPMIVVGAAAGDEHTRQFWIDAERLYFVRMLSPAPRDTAKVQDIRFTSYERHGDAWVAPRVEIWTDGRLVFTEDYTDINLDVPLDDALFEPAHWRTAKHWMTAR